MFNMSTLITFWRRIQSASKSRNLWFVFCLFLGIVLLYPQASQSQTKTRNHSAKRLYSIGGTGQVYTIDAPESKNKKRKKTQKKKSKSKKAKTVRRLSRAQKAKLLAMRKQRRLKQMRLDREREDERALWSESIASSSKTRVKKRKSRTEKNLRLDWRIKLTGVGFENETDSAQLTALSFDNRFQYRLVDSLKLKSELGVRLGTGRSQSRFGEYTVVNGLKVSEAVLKYSPIPYFSIEAGAAKADSVAENLMRKSLAFPGVKETLKYKSKIFAIELSAIQAIPTSETLSNDAVDKEATPTYFSELLTLSLKPHEMIVGKAYIQHYSFQNLPSAVAEASSIHGNSVFDLGTNSSSFQYDFNGWLFGGSGALIIDNRFSIQGDLYMISNLEAPEAYNQGQLASVSLNSQFKDFDLRFEYANFFTESDATPAFYNSAGFGHTNRQGYGLSGLVSFKKLGFKLKFNYVEAQLINLTPNQSDQQQIGIQLETFYDRLL